MNGKKGWLTKKELAIAVISAVISVILTLVLAPYIQNVLTYGPNPDNIIPPKPQLRIEKVDVEAMNQPNPGIYLELMNDGEKSVKEEQYLFEITNKRKNGNCNGNLFAEQVIAFYSTENETCSMGLRTILPNEKIGLTLRELERSKTNFTKSQQLANIQSCRQEETISICFVKRDDVKMQTQTCAAVFSQPINCKETQASIDYQNGSIHILKAK